MVTAREEWVGMLRALGQALLDVLRAEAAALAADLRRSGHYLWIGLALLGAAAGVLFWTFGLLLFTLVAVAAIWLPLWGAALVVLGVFVLAAGVLAALGVSRLRRIENPAADVKRRVADHVDWWRQRLLGQAGGEGAALPPPGLGASAPEEEP
jgi:hypothetical protein